MYSSDNFFLHNLKDKFSQLINELSDQEIRQSTQILIAETKALIDDHLEGGDELPPDPNPEG